MLLNDAINICLRYIGETPVPDGVDIDSLDPLHEAVVIRQMLDEISENIQATGWWFNREEWTFIPDTNNRIGIPTNVLAIETTENYINRGGSLYNRDNQSYEFTDAFTADVVFKWDFEELPRTMASYITYLTAKDVQVYLNGDDFTDKQLDKQIGQALVRVEQEHLRHNKYNLVSGRRIVSRTTIPTGVS